MNRDHGNATQRFDADAHRVKLQRAFEQCLSSDQSTESNLSGTVRHALAHRGSMARAELCHLVGRGFNLEEARAMDLAVTVELFHTASLLFDDLPAMDDAKERRGAACAHLVFGEGATMLAALALINRAYALLWSVLRGASPESQAAGARFVEKCLGLSGVLNGQSHDLHFKASRYSANRVMRVALGKTVSLVRLTLVLPAIVAGADSQSIRALSRLSVVWGLAYQITDDLKDILRSAAAKKTTGRDAVLGRPNLALAEGPVRTSSVLGRLIWLGEVTIARLTEESPALESLRGFQRKVAGEYLELQLAGTLS